MTGTLVRSIAALARTATEAFTPEELLQRLADLAAETLDADGVGVMIVEDGMSRFVHSSGSDAARLECVQELLQIGPCCEAILNGNEVVIENLAACSNAEWAPFVKEALAVNVHAAVALPLVSRGRSWGVLDLYRTRPQQWDEGTLEAARLLADVAVSYLVMAADRDEAKRAQLESAHRASHDALTGVANRMLAFDRLEHALAGARRHGGRVAVLFIDLDGFKLVNDTLGHEAGDQVLVTVARRISAALRANDSVARLGGDEFVVICEDIDGSNDAKLHDAAHTIAAHLRDVLEQPVRFGSQELRIAASIGIAISGGHDRPDDIMAAADADMYAVKRRRQQNFARPA